MALRIYLNNVFVLMSFGALLLYGLTIDSGPYLQKLSSGTFFELVYYTLLAGACYTPTNLVGLSVISAFIGEETTRDRDGGEIILERMWRKAVFRGMVVFASTFAVSSYISLESLLHATQEDYCRFAGATIAAGFGLSGVQNVLKKHSAA